MKKTNFDAYLEEQLRNKEFATRFEKAGAEWNLGAKVRLVFERSDASKPSAVAEARAKYRAR